MTCSVRCSFPTAHTYVHAWCMVGQTLVDRSVTWLAAATCLLPHLDDWLIWWREDVLGLRMSGNVSWLVDAAVVELWSVLEEPRLVWLWYTWLVWTCLFTILSISYQYHPHCDCQHWYLSISQSQFFSVLSSMYVKGTLSWKYHFLEKMTYVYIENK